MKLDIKAFALAFGLIWGGSVLAVAVANQLWPGYGRLFLEVTASVYPGYQPGVGIASIITGALYGLVDGAIGGAVFAWLYNRLARR